MLLEIILRMSEEITVGSNTSSLFGFSIWGVYSDTVPLHPLRTLYTVILRVRFTSPDQIRKFQVRWHQLNIWISSGRMAIPPVSLFLLNENMLCERNCIYKAVWGEGKHSRDVVKISSVNSFQAICQTLILFFLWKGMTRKNFNDLYMAINLP